MEARYPNTSVDKLPGENYKPASIPVSDRDMVTDVYKLSAVSILKMCDCLEYQSCETDDYGETLAFQLLDQIRREAIRALPRYDDGPWDFVLPARTVA